MLKVMTQSDLPLASIDSRTDAVRITPLQGNAAAFTLLLLQMGLSALLLKYAPFGMGLSMLITALLTLLVLFVVFKNPLSELWHSERWRAKFTWRTVAITLGVFILAFIASRLWAMSAIFLLPEQKTMPPQLLSDGLDQFLLLLAGGLLIPFAEELVFRGLMLRGHERVAGFGLAALTTTVAFSFAHQVPMQVIGILPLAYVLAKIVQYTHNFWTAVVIHVLNNSISLLLLWIATLFGQSSSQQLNADAMNSLNQLIANPSLKLPLGFLLFFAGAICLVILHFWLTGSKEATKEQQALVAASAAPTLAKGQGGLAWLDAFYGVILLWGLGMFGWLLFFR